MLDPPRDAMGCPRASSSTRIVYHRSLPHAHTAPSTRLDSLPADAWPESVPFSVPIEPSSPDAPEGIYATSTFAPKRAFVRHRNSSGAPRVLPNARRSIDLYAPSAYHIEKLPFAPRRYTNNPLFPSTYTHDLFSSHPLSFSPCAILTVCPCLSAISFYLSRGSHKQPLLISLPFIALPGSVAHPPIC